MTVSLYTDTFGQGHASDTCYSQSAGYKSCWNGCCGPDNNQDCCSSTVLILGLSLGGGVVLIVVLVVVLCWVCKDCQPKSCCGRRRSDVGGTRGGRGGRGNGQSARRQRVVVQPVEPPDYETAAQLRAPSVQPGCNHRNLPLTPPPPYTEAVPPPPTAPPSGTTQPIASPRHRNPTHTAVQSRLMTVSASVGITLTPPQEGLTSPCPVEEVRSSSRHSGASYTGQSGPNSPAAPNRGSRVTSTFTSIGQATQSSAVNSNSVSVRHAATAVRGLLNNANVVLPRADNLGHSDNTTSAAGVETGMASHNHTQQPLTTNRDINRQANTNTNSVYVVRPAQNASSSSGSTARPRPAESRSTSRNRPRAAEVSQSVAPRNALHVSVASNDSAQRGTVPKHQSSPKEGVDARAMAIQERTPPGNNGNRVRGSESGSSGQPQRNRSRMTRGTRPGQDEGADSGGGATRHTVNESANDDLDPLYLV
ncbi:uncharacterized protein [Littorina saxatilis]|uniref:uncharacterized protein n=1 Tax=Littorina saxatilis TaxID=31220 RepID=UPI0038B611D9